MCTNDSCSGRSKALTHVHCACSLRVSLYTPDHFDCLLQALRLQFLRCREEWLGELIAELDPGSAYEYLKRLTDVHRLHMFDVVMQFRAIFSDESAGQVWFLHTVVVLQAGAHLLGPCQTYDGHGTGLRPCL